jgi:phospholipid/cholesterol/gamma-HCH transport system substrate-binding protein
MLTLGMKLKNVAFLLIGVLVLGHLAVSYADLGRFVGVQNYYVVYVDLPETGGLYTHAGVRYRGVPVGRVGPIDLTDGGVQAQLRIDKSAPPIPADLDAVVANLSAIGEQYIDLRPRTAEGPRLTDGTVVPKGATSIPEPVTAMLSSLDRLTSSVPLDSLETVVDELGTGFEGQAGSLQRLLDAGSDIIEAADESLPATTRLIVDAETVLRTQAEQGDALRAFATGAFQLAGQLRESDGDLRRLIGTAPGAATQISGLLGDVDPGLSIVLANLLTTSEVVLTRQHGLEELLVRIPQAVAAGSTSVTDDGVNFGLALTFFQPLPCTAGYQGTAYRNGLDTSAAPPLNTEARCTAPASSGIAVRGSANAPSGGAAEVSRPLR